MNRTVALAGITARRIQAHGGHRQRLVALAPAVTLAFLAACGTTPRVPSSDVSHLPPGNSQRDGPEAHPPTDLWTVPDAVPQIEALRIGGPNKPYEVDGHTYVPITDDRAVVERGLASWYGKKFHGRRTSSGEAYNMYAMTAAHKTLPIPSYARVRNPSNGREVIVRVNDRGPFATGRIIDLSYTAALKLGVLGGVQPVEVERITDDDIRTGAAFQHGGTRLASSTSSPPAQATNSPRATEPATQATAPSAQRGEALGQGTGPLSPSIPPSLTTGTTMTTTVTTTTVAALPAWGAAAQAAESTSRGVNGTSIEHTQTGISPAIATTAGVALLDGHSQIASTAGSPQPAAVALRPAAPTVIASAGAGATTPAEVASTTTLPSSGAETAGAGDDTTPVTSDVAKAGASPAEAQAAAAQTAAAPLAGGGGYAAVLPPVVVASTRPAAQGAGESGRPLPALREESAHAETPGGAGFWVQLGAYRQRNGALDFQHRLIDEQPWLAPLLAVFSENGLNRLQAGPYVSREDARSAAERIRVALQLVPTIIEKH